jgi:hypothetical protein
MTTYLKKKSVTILGQPLTGLKVGETEVSAPGEAIGLTSSDSSIEITPNVETGEIDLKVSDAVQWAQVTW